MIPDSGEPGRLELKILAGRADLGRKFLYAGPSWPKSARSGDFKHYGHFFENGQFGPKY